MKYSDIEIGLKSEISHTITQEDLNKFVDLTGDNNKLHVDKEYASNTNFKKPVVHGMLGASFISTIIGTKIPGNGALWFSQSLEFVYPVRIGDTILITAEVKKKIDKENIIELETNIYNQNKQLVTKGYAKVKVIEQIEKVKEEKINRRKVALVIGSTGGIGEAVVKKLVEDGFDIALHYNSNQDKACDMHKEIISINRITKSFPIQANIRNPHEVERLVEKALHYFNNIDVVVNCATISIPAIPILDLTWQDWQNQIDSHIKSTFLIIQKIIPSMIKNGSGKIINIGSMAVDKPNAKWSHYITAKAGLEGLTKALAFELAPKGINVNMVTPSLVNTELTSDIPEKTKLLIASQTPLRRLATTEDVANTISFLASDKADFITGENIRLNGGQVMI